MALVKTLGKVLFKLSGFLERLSLSEMQVSFVSESYNLFQWKLILVGGAVPPIGLEKLTAKSISVIRPTLRNYISTRGRLERYGNKALEMVQGGNWKILKHDRYYSLEEVEQAHRDLENRATKGKLLIRL